MNRLIVVAGVFGVLFFYGCGGSAEITCDEMRPYQLVTESRRVQTPEDLDALEPLREMPLPEASPRAQRPAGSPCLDRPPAISIGD